MMDGIGYDRDSVAQMMDFFFFWMRMMDGDGIPPGSTPAGPHEGKGFRLTADVIIK